MKTMLSITAIAALLAIPAYAADASKAVTPDTAIPGKVVPKDAMTSKPITPAEPAASPAAAAPADTMAKTPADTTAQAPADTMAKTPANTTTQVPADTMAKTPADIIAKTPVDTTASTNMAATGEIRYLPSQKSGEFLVSRIMGAYVVNNAKETVGEVNDIILDQGGKVAGVVVGVGGFLGMGERNVAVAYESSQISTDANGKHIIKLNVTKDTLQNAAVYVKLNKGL